MKQELIDFITEKKKRGIPPKLIKNALVKAGYDLRIVEEHLNHVFKKEFAFANKKKILIPLIVVFILVLIAGFYYFKTASPENKVRG